VYKSEPAKKRLDQTSHRGAVSIRCRRVRSPLLHEWGPRRADSRELLTPEPTLSWLSGRRLAGCMAYLQTETF